MGECLGIEKPCNLITANAVVTDHDDLAVAIELLHPRRYLTHRNVNRIREHAARDLPWLAHIEEHWLRIGRAQARVEFMHRQLLHQNTNLDGSIALMSDG